MMLLDQADSGFVIDDPFDPRTWEADLPPDFPVQLCLSSRWDLHCWLDYQDWQWARQFLWCHTYGAGPMQERNGIRVISRPNHIYARRCEGGSTIWMHRDILLKTKGYPRRSTMIGDHKDGNTLNNRRCNLRWATRSQNSLNVPGSRARMRFERATASDQGGSYVPA